jgi:hypothetical protein
MIVATIDPAGNTDLHRSLGRDVLHFPSDQKQKARTDHRREFGRAVE